MGLDYYTVLGLTRSADDLEIKKAYRRLALKHHPARDSGPESRMEYARVTEAYDVLSTPQWKGVYDLYGEQPLKCGSDQVADAAIKAYTFDESKCEQVFSKFFGTDNPFEAIEDMASSFKMAAGPDKDVGAKQLVLNIDIPLAQIATGCRKQVNYQRKHILHDDLLVEDRSVTIDVKPGMLDGTIFLFKGEGNIAPKKVPGSLMLTIKAEAHPRFKRLGADLLYPMSISLCHALTGVPLTVPLLDGTSVNVSPPDIVTPGQHICVPGRGLPNPATGSPGNLILEMDIHFPSKLSEVQKKLFKAAFSLPENLEPCDAVKDFISSFENPTDGWQIRD